MDLIGKEYKSARELYERALKGYEEQLGPAHPDTLATVHGLAIVYGVQGRYKEAEQLYERALKGREEQLGLLPNRSQSTKW